MAPCVRINQNNVYYVKNSAKRMLQRNEKTRGKACNDLEGRENQNQKRQEGFLFAVFLFEE